MGGVVAVVGDLDLADPMAASPSPNPSILLLNQVASLARISDMACSFSQIRGTAKKIVGCTSRRFSLTVSIDSAKFSTGPAPTIVQVEKIRSATWHSGR